MKITEKGLFDDSDLKKPSMPIEESFDAEKRRKFSNHK